MGRRGRADRRRHRRRPARRGRRRLRPRGPRRGRRTRRRHRTSPTRHGPPSASTSTSGSAWTSSSRSAATACWPWPSTPSASNRSTTGEVTTWHISRNPPRVAGPSTGPSSAPRRSTTTDSIDPEHYKLEQQAIFKKTWLNVGRVERLPKKGSYFTREMPSVGPGTSVIIVKDKDGESSARSTTCAATAATSWCGTTIPGEEVSGTCRQFTCKYHAWRYSLEGDLTFVQQEDEFFDLDKATYGLVPVRCEVWEGFIFINFDNDAAPLTEYLGRLRRGPRGLSVPRDDRALQLPRRDQRATGSCSSTRSPSSTTRRSCT